MIQLGKREGATRREPVLADDWVADSPPREVTEQLLGWKRRMLARNWLGTKSNRA